MSANGQIRIRTAEDIRDALRSTDPGIRFSMLGAIIKNPEAAAAYGPVDGNDLIDELCSQVRSLSASPLRTLVLGALVAYRDPRVQDIFKLEIHASECAETLTLAAKYLAGETGADVKRELTSLLLQNNSISHARAAADALRDHAELSDRERIRIALFGTEESTPPCLNHQTGPCWMEELHGPHGVRARALIEAQGQAAFVYLRGKWDRLGDEDKAWLLAWGARHHPAYAVEPILQGLDAGSEQLARAALEAIALMGEAGQIFLAHTGRHLKSSDPAVRRAVVRAGAAGVDWEAALAEENDTSVKLAMLHRVAQEKGESAAPTLILLVEQGDYRLRAAATAVLKTFARGVAESMKPLMQHPLRAVQVAAAQVLIAAGEELWLEEQMLS